MNNITIGIEPVKIYGAKVVNAEGRQWVAIPIDTLSLSKDGTKAFLNLDIREKREPAYGNTHYVTQNLKGEIYKTLTDEEKRSRLPILGNGKPIGDAAPAFQPESNEDFF